MPRRQSQKTSSVLHGGAGGRESRSVLLLGEANFSFALALRLLLERPAAPTATSAKDLEQQRAVEELFTEQLTSVSQYLHLPCELCQQTRITASCYEAHGELTEKYPESVGILSRLAPLGVEVRFSVNAWDLKTSFGDQVWDVIAWNHPHLGTEDFKLHRFLLAHFFAAVTEHLVPDGRVVLTLLEGQEKRWEILEQAARHGFALLRDPVLFSAAAFPGYESKRNSTGRSFKNLPTQRMAPGSMRSWTYHLQLHADKAPISMPSASPTKVLKLTSTCEFCGKGFSSAQGLKTHTRQVHELKKYGDRTGPAKAFACEVCDRTFSDAEALQQHRAAAHGTSTAPTARPRSVEGGYSLRSCKVCGMSLPLGMSMAAHLEALKPCGDLPYACVCGRAFVELRAVEQHQRSCKQHLEGQHSRRWVALLARLSQRCCGR
ncbi:unnamed protein product [Durusdinium trenchii]|uniref:Zinc finger protein 879 n=2 Tax=Durusdinium trenchii TaxID=1381693 RepID=A0ABP0Q5Y3_9DINO